MAQHEGEERITSRVTPRVGRDSSGTGWQQLKMQVLSGFSEMGGQGGERGFEGFVDNLPSHQIIQYAVPWPLHLVVTAQVRRKSLQKHNLDSCT